MRIALLGGHFSRLATAEALAAVATVATCCLRRRRPGRGHLGVFAQPLSFVGLPVISVPVVAADRLPLGVQLVAAPFNEAALFRVAARLEAEGPVRAPVA